MDSTEPKPPRPPEPEVPPEGEQDPKEEKECGHDDSEPDRAASGARPHHMANLLGIEAIL